MTPDYFSLLHGMCSISEPSINDIIAIFKEFRRSLDGEKPKPSVSASPSLPTSSGVAKKRGTKSSKKATRASASSAASDEAAAGGSGATISNVGFERPCSWEPEKTRCWIISDLDLWNRILCRGCIELREHQWGELTLQGYPWPETKPEVRDILRASLLSHLLLRQHRCLTCIFLDLSETMLERYIMWHALLTGAGGIKNFEFKPYSVDTLGEMTFVERIVWAESVSSLTNLSTLHLSGIHFQVDVARILGAYVERSTALGTLQLKNIKADDTEAGVFLDALARNRTVKRLCVQESFILARHGQALAAVIQNHVALEKLEVTGSPACSPSALLSAVVQSQTLKSLTVDTCAVRAEDIDALAAALTLRPPYLRRDGKQVLPFPPRGRIERLTFINCISRDLRMDQAYGNLIGGVVVFLRFSQCCLGDRFAAAAGLNLLCDRRLQELHVADNDFSVAALSNMVGMLQANKTLQALVISLRGTQPQDEIAGLFDLIQKIDVFSRLRLVWFHPRGLDFARGVRASQVPTIVQNLDEMGEEDAENFLDALVSTPKVGMLLLQCAEPAGPRVVRKLTDTLAQINSLGHLLLHVNLAEADVVNLFRSLEGNSSIALMEIRRITFRRRAAKALGRLVERNRTLVSVIVDLEDSDPVVDYMIQLRTVCRELKEALSRNRFVIGVTVNVERGKDRSRDPVILGALRRNLMLANSAVHFVNGSTEKKDALAFETLQYSFSIQLSLRLCFDVPDESLEEMITEARRRLAFDYFVLVGVVKARIVCNPHPKRKTTFDKIGRDMQARICSYLSLTDVVDI